MKNGLFLENNELIYYENDQPVHAGVIKINDDYYYIGTGGKAVRGVHHVHTVMANDLLKRGTYTFGDDYKLIEGSYVAPKRRKHKKHTHHSHRSKRSRKRLKLSKKQKLYINIISAILSVLLVVGAIAIGINNYNKPHKNDDDNISNIIIPSFDEEVMLCSPVAKKLYDNETTIKIAKQSGDPYRPLIFDYLINNEESATLTISEHKDYSDAMRYTLDPDETCIEIDNLKTNKTYYYKVEHQDKEQNGTFKTAQCYRFVSIDGLVNTRDIGGYKTLDGETVKQGLLIRGPEIDALMMRNYIIPAESIDDVLDTFGFVYDFDLRSPTIYNGDFHTRFGKTVKHRFYDSPTYAHIFSEQYKKNLKNIFTDLADEKNYPMYFHCTYGADRTGTIVYLLQGVLNVSHEDMKREYMLTSLYNQVQLSEHSLETIDEGLEKYKGDTIQERIVDFLKTDIGITQKQIDSIRRIYLENE